MAAGVYHLKIERGAVFARTFVWRDDADVPINLTGYVAHMHLAVNGLLIADWSPHFLIDGPTGAVILTVPATETGLTKPAGNYDIELTPPSGPAGTVRFLQGQWSVSPDVTMDLVARRGLGTP